MKSFLGHAKLCEMLCLSFMRFHEIKHSSFPHIHRKFKICLSTGLCRENFLKRKMNLGKLSFALERKTNLIFYLVNSINTREYIYIKSILNFFLSFNAKNIKY